MPVDLTIRLRRTSETAMLLARLQELNIVDCASTTEPVYTTDATSGRDIVCKCCDHARPDIRAHEDNNEIERVFNMLVGAGVRVMDPVRPVPGLAFLKH